MILCIWSGKFIFTLSSSTKETDTMYDLSKVPEIFTQN